ATAPNTVLHNRWESMDAYFADLPRSRRRRLSALHRRAGEETLSSAARGAAARRAAPRTA
ncbi:hypothetical protein DKT74_32670, partial [Streptomyces sp. ZEA17I]